MVFPTKPGSLKRHLGDDNASYLEDGNDNGSCDVHSTIDESLRVEPSTKRKRLFDFGAHPRRKIAIQFLYYGWEFDGLIQQTTTENTVEKHLMAAFLKTKLIFDEKNCDFSRCGRTDKGVSAFRQVAALIVRSADVSGKFVFWHDSADKSVIANYPRKEELSYLKMLNGVLPSTIRVISWAAVPRNFSARHSCTMRIYKYSLPKANLNIEAMRQACALLIGTHDFRNFCQVDMNEKRVTMSYVREIFDVTIETLSSNESGPPRTDLLELTVCGSGFLYHMIRYIVTVLHEIGMGNENPELVADLLDIDKMPCRPHYTLAVATPLSLHECRFDFAKLEWIYDDYTSKRIIASLQGDWANLQTKARLIENMLSGLLDVHFASQIDLNKGFLEFTQDHPLPSRYIKFVERKTCDSLEQKREKLERKKNASGV